MKTKSLFDRISQASTKLVNSVYLEKEVELPGGMTVVLGTLTTDEEAEVHEYASSWNGIAMLMRMKQDKLAFSIKNLDGIDVNVESIEVGKTSDGTPLMESKRFVLRREIEKWDETVVQYLFNFLAEMTEELDQKMKPAAKVEMKPELEPHQPEPVAPPVLDSGEDDAGDDA